MRVRVVGRLGSRAKYALAREGAAGMWIPDDVRKCVAFAAHKKPDGTRQVGGTVFFVSIEFSDSESAVYVVTAKHVIESIRKNIVSPYMSVRMNFKERRVDYVEIPDDAWQFHEDSSVDAAVAEFDIPDDADHLAFPFSGFATDEFIKEKEVGVGDDLFFTGLFLKHVPESRNVPIIRIGNIAAMPEEPVGTDYGYAEAYLVEARSIGGLSGSPVFIHRGPKLEAKGSFLFEAQPEFHLLGLIHGHKDMPNFDSGDASVFSEEKINTGIAIVVPISKVMDILNCQRFVDARAITRADIEKRDAATPDDHS